MIALAIVGAILITIDVTMAIIIYRKQRGE